MKTKIQIIFFIFFLCVTCYMLHVTQVSAQSSTLPLSAFPAIQDKEVTPGEKTRLQVQFKNGSDIVVSGYVKTADFTIGDKQGTPILIENAQQKPKYGAASWITPLTDFISIPPHDFITVDLFITVPTEVGTCGNYAIVYFQPSPESMKAALGGSRASASSVTQKLGTLINFQVQKQACKEGAQISRFETPTLMEYGPIEASFDILNTGDLHITPKGVLITSNIVGQPTDQQILQEQRIFPESAKEYKATIGQRLMFGRYKLSLNASYGLKDQLLSKTAYVWIIPWKIITVILLAILILILLITNTYKGFAVKEHTLERSLEEEHAEIERLREELKRKRE